MGFPVSMWYGNPDKTGAFMAKLGADKADFIVAQTSDRDAGCFEVPTPVDECAGRGNGPFYLDKAKGILLATSDKGVRLYNLDDGKERWALDQDLPNSYRVMSFFGNNSFAVIRSMMQNRIYVPTNPPPVEGDGVVYVASSDEVFAIDAGSGKLNWTSKSKNLSLVSGLSFSGNGSTDPAVSTDDIVRAVRSGGNTSVTNDQNNGFLLDEVSPKIVGVQPVQISTPTQAGAGLYLTTVDYTLDFCASRLKVGDVIQQPGVFAEVTIASGNPTGGTVADVQFWAVGLSKGSD